MTTTHDAAVLTAEAPSAPVPAAGRAFTVRLDKTDSDRIDDITTRMRRQTGRPLHQSDVIRGLLALADQHDDVRALLLERLRR